MHSKIVGNLIFTVPSRDIEFFEGQGQNGDSDNVEEIYLFPRLGALIS